MSRQFSVFSLKTPRHRPITRLSYDNCKAGHQPIRRSALRLPSQQAFGTAPNAFALELSDRASPLEQVQAQRIRCPLQIWKGSIVKIYVGNLSYNTGEDGLRSLFSQHGAVSDVFVASDRETGRSRGFGFVTMPDDAQAKAAIEKCNGNQLDGRTLTVNEARPPAQSGGGGGGGGYGGGGGGGGGRGGYRDRR